MKILCLLAITTVVFAVHAQRDFSNVEIKTVPVTDSIYMLEGSGGNIGVSVGSDGILIVDDQFAGLSEKIEAALVKLEHATVRFVLNTHHHGDHTGGNAMLAEKGATILSHRNVRKRLADEGKDGLPMITFDESVSVHFNAEEIKLIHLGPGHTDGDSVVHFTGANVIHMGDLLFNGRFPYVDLGNGGSVDGYIESVRTVLSHATAETKIIPGHGPLATMDDLKQFHAMLQETVEMVRQAKSAGKSLDEIQTAGLPDKYKDWGAGFITTDRWIETIYQESNN